MYVFTKYLDANKIRPLSFENVYLRSINGHAMTEFFNNIAHVDNGSGEQICSNLTFRQPLQVSGNVNVRLSTSQWNGINVADTVGQFQTNQLAIDYTNQLEQLRSVAVALTDQLKSRSTQSQS